MPCRNDYEDPRNTITTVNCDKYKDEANKWEAAFCALINEFDRQYGGVVMNSLFVLATKNSGLNIKELYDQHLKKDIGRIEEDLKKYSNDELGLIKMLLNKNKQL